jgi:LuxR family maltose regulon positive regulatory protein
MVDADARRLGRRAPRLGQQAVERKRLLARLTDGREYRIVLICAPAGFGKTILATQLSRRDPRHGCWLTLEKAHNDPVRLVNDVVRTLTDLGLIAPRIAHELDRPGPRISEVVMPLLREELASCPPLALVLDDVDLLVHPDSLAIVAFLVDHASPGSQLVLAGRGEPEIPLARLRAAGEVLDLRAADLAFDSSETRELLDAAGVKLSDEQVEAVRERAEGWVSGIALAVLYQPDGAFADEMPQVAISATGAVAAYLVEEAVQNQPSEVRRFLLASSMLRRMSPALCDAVLHINYSGRILARLEHDSLFVVSLSGDAEWYRYHDLFRELLQAELRRKAPELIDGILRRAAEWHEDHGDPDEAFEYAHACGDLPRAGRILLRLGTPLVARGQIATVRSWLARCTREEMGSDPSLALAGAWVALLSGDAGEASRLAAVAATAGEPDVPSPDGVSSVRSSLANLRATLGSDGVSQMLRDAESLLALEGSAAVDGWRQIGIAHILSGRPDDAIAAFGEVLLRAKGRPDLINLTIHCLGYSALAAADAGDWRRTRKLACEAYALTNESGLLGVINSVSPFTAYAIVQQHDALIPQAEKALQHVRQMLPMLHAMRWFEADISLRCAELSLYLGDREAALELADVARAALDEYPDPGMLLVRLKSLDTRLRSASLLRLTPSELRLAPLLSSQLSLQEISARLYLSRATVKTHTDAIYRKLQVVKRSDAVQRLEAMGLSRRQGERSEPRSGVPDRP